MKCLGKNNTVQFTKTLYSIIAPGRTRARSISHTGRFPLRCVLLLAAGSWQSVTSKRLVQSWLYSWVIALAWTSLLCCIFSSISTGNMPCTLNARALTDKPQLLYIHTHKQPATNMFFFVFPLRGRRPFWLSAIFEVWHFMNNLDEKHSWEFQLTWNFVHLALASAFSAGV